MSTALKQKPALTPTPYSSPERARLAAEIVAAAAEGARRVALEKAVATAGAELRAATRAAETASEAVEQAKSNATRHLVDTALGSPGAAPQTTRQARAALEEAQDHLEECRTTRAALDAELSAEQSRPNYAAMRVKDAAIAVIKAEMAERAVVLAARVAEMQQELVARGSTLQWLSEAGATVPMYGPSYSALTEAEKGIRATIARLDVAPNQWAIGTIRYATSVWEPTGRLAWEAAFEALKRNADAVLPGED